MQDSPVNLAIDDSNLRMFKLLCTRKHDSSQRVSSRHHFALLNVHMKSKTSDISDQLGHQAYANTALMLVILSSTRVYCLMLSYL